MKLDITQPREGWSSSASLDGIATLNKKSQWPTLKGRLQHPITTVKEAIEQLQLSVPITPHAKKIWQGFQRRASFHKACRSERH